MKSRNQSYIIYLLLFIAIVAMVYFNIKQQPSTQGPLYIGDVAKQVEAGTITRIQIKDDNSLSIISGSGNSAIEQTARKEPETTLVSQLLALGVTPEQLAKVSIEVIPPSPWAGVLNVLWVILPVILLGGLFWFMFRQAQGSNNAAMAFGKSKARMFSGEHPTVTFEDVAGIDESKEELQEIVEFLKERRIVGGTSRHR